MGFRLESLNRNLSILMLFSFAIVAVLYVFMTFVDPRPYQIIFTDIEVDYYYNARLVHHGLPVSGVHHPGTPVHYLGSIILALTSSSVEATQDFFNLSYFVIAFLTVVSLSIFIYLALREVPIGISFFALALVVAWPTFSFYLNHFGADAFVVIIGLPTIAIYWKDLGGGAVPRYRNLFLCGVGIGVSLAVKMSFLPLALALFAGCTARAILPLYGYFKANRSLNKRGLMQSFFSALMMPLGVIIMYTFMTLPIHGRVPGIWMEALSSHGVTLGIWVLLRGIIEIVFYFLNANPLMAVLIIVPILVFFYACLKFVYQFVFTRERPRGPVFIEKERFDYISGAIFLGLSLLAFGFLLIPTIKTYGHNASVLEGHALRNVYPVALFLPFLVLFCWRVLNFRKENKILGYKWFQVLLIVVSLLSVVYAMLPFVARRNDFIASRSLLTRNMRQKVEKLAVPGTRIAFWDGTSMHALGKLSFHWWGNYRYAHSSFDGSLVADYPAYTQFRLRGTKKLLRKITISGGTPGKKNRIPEESLSQGFRRRLRAQLIKFWGTFTIALPSAWKIRNTEAFYKNQRRGLIVAPKKGTPVSLIAIPKLEVKNELGVAGSKLKMGLLRIIENRFEVDRVWEESIEGVDWIFVSGKVLRNINER